VESGLPNVPATPKAPPARKAGEAAIHEARQRFIAAFSRQAASMAALISAVAELRSEGPIDSLLRMLHDIGGHARAIGFPRVSSRAAAIEAVIADSRSTGIDLQSACQMIEALRQDFATDLVSEAGGLAPAPELAAETGKILVVDDDAQTREGLTEYFVTMGYLAIGLPAADSLLPVARDERPDLILLDVGLPGIDGFAACRLLKTEPTLSHIPVIFLTGQVGIDDRLTSLALGAEEFLAKPVDVREVMLRIRIQLARSRQVSQAVSNPGGDRRQGKLSYEAFATTAAETLQQSEAALALVRLPRERRADASAAITGALRRRELVGRYDHGHLAILMPETSANHARRWLTEVIRELAARGVHGVYAGVAASISPGTRTLDELLVEADEALATARSCGEPAATTSDAAFASRPGRGITVLLTDDDPDVIRLVDSQLRATGYRTVIAFDGVQAMAEIETHRPDVLVLDLMLPRMSGFDVLDALGRLGTSGPQVVVLSGRGHEEDVLRAFAAGAADYMTKPFNVAELLVRIERLAHLATRE
jgi:two-component system, cell cycle response regulator